MKVYTKTGDLGETSTFGGKRVSKSSVRIETNGTIDELNSVVGILVSKLEYGKIKEQLFRIQNELFEAGADVSTGVNNPKNEFRINLEFITRLENEIDEMDKDLPPLKSFILPGGCEESALAHWCRSVCRRAERQCVVLYNIEKTNPFLIAYLNRLSDWLFVLARYLNLLNKTSEIKFISKK